MKIGLWVYIAAFTGIWVATVADPELRGTTTELAVDFVLFAVTLAGLIAYAIDLHKPRLIAAWKFIAPALLLGFVVQMTVEAFSLSAPDPGLSLAEQRVMLGIALAVTALFLAPAIIVNFRLASRMDATDSGN